MAVSGCSAFIGAGSSAQSGMPRWSELLERLQDAAVAATGSDIQTPSKDALVRAQAYETAIGREGVGQIISDLYSRPPAATIHAAFHTNLFGIPFRQVVTTNYDLVIESAYAGAGRLPLSLDWEDEAARTFFVDALANPNAETSVVHLHGSVRRPSEVVLGLKSYDRVYRRDNSSQAALQTLLMVSRFLFVGFSFDDAVFRQTLDRLRAIYEPTMVKHVAILPSRSASEDTTFAADLLAKDRVEALLYDPSNRHAQLLALIDRLARDVRTNIAAREREQRRRQLLGLGLAPEETLRQLRRIAADFDAIGRNETPTSTSGPRVALDDDIDTIARLTQAGKPMLAVREFDELDRVHHADFDDRLRFRVSANRGHARFGAGNAEEAAGDYSIASSHCAEDDRNKLWFKCLSLDLSGRSAEARECADQFIAKHADFDQAWAVWVRTRPADEPIRELRHRVPRRMRREAEVASILSIRHRAARRARGALAYARQTVRDAPGRPPATALLAATLIHHAAANAIVRLPRGLVPRSPDIVADAVRLLDETIAALRTGDATPLLMSCFYNRASAKRLLGDFAGSEADVRELHRLFPHDPHAVARLALILGRENDPEEVIALIDGAGEAGTLGPSQFFLASALTHRNAAGDRPRAISVLRDLVARGPDGLPEGYSDAVGLLSSLLMYSGQEEEAKSTLRATQSNVKSPLLTQARLIEAECWSAGKRTTTDSARVAIRSVASDAVASGDALVRLEIAQTAFDLHEPGVAADLLGGYIDLTAMSAAARLLVRSLRESGRDPALIQACRSLRRSCPDERELLVDEVNALMRNAEDREALDRLREWYDRHPTDREAFLHIGRLAIRTGRRECASYDLDKLPSPDELSSASLGTNVVEYLTAGGATESARHYAYELYRHFPSDEEAIRTLIFVELTTTSSGVATHFDSVDADTSFTLVSEADGSELHLTVETAPRLADEHRPDDPLVAAALGKTIGTKVVVGDATFVIRSVHDKVRWRTHLCMTEYARRFPQSDAMVEYTVPDDVIEKADVKQLLGPMYDVMAEDDERRQRSLSLYGTGIVPIACVAVALRRPIVSLMAFLSSSHRSIYAQAARDDRRDVRLLVQTRAAVLDETALATLYSLDFEPLLKGIGFKLVVPGTALHPLRHLLAGLRDREDQSNRSMGLESGRLFVVETPPSVRAAQADRLGRFLSAIDGSCEIAGGLSRHSMPANLRNALEKTVGAGLVDAVAIALERRLPLWTDDDALVPLCLSRAGVRRVSTQRALSSSKLDKALVKSASRKLLQLGYEFVSLRVEDLQTLFRDAAWRPSDRSLKRVFQYLARHATMTPNNVGVTRSLLEVLWYQCPRRQRRRIMMSVLRVLPADSKQKIVRPLIAACERQPRAKRLGRRTLADALRYWIKTSPSAPRAG